MSNDELKDCILHLLERSENRIDRTNGMIHELADVTRQHQEMYDKHLTTLEASRDLAQKNLGDLIAMHNHIRADYREMINNLQRVIDGYKEELHSAKARIITLEAELAHLAGLGKVEVNIDSKNEKK